MLAIGLLLYERLNLLYFIKVISILVTDFKAEDYYSF